MKIVDRKQIELALAKLDLLAVIEDGFAAYSAGDSVVPPVGELLMDKGEVHIKYGYIKGDDRYVIKVASGFSGNEPLGLANSNGLLLVFSQNTGLLEAILLDEGRLTDVRTAVAGAIACKYLAPKVIQAIGIVGTGIQARLQLQYLANVCSCRSVIVWGRNLSKLDQYKGDFKNSQFDINTTMDINRLTDQCNLIITTTAAKQPLLMSGAIRPGTHITAVGSDTPMKRELDGALLKSARYIVADSKLQCLQRGEIYQAIKDKLIDDREVIELGDVISGKSTVERSQADITVADLTGVAVQDIKIAQAVLAAI